MEFAGECEQAESIRYTCSRDPAHYSKEIILLVDWLFFQKEILQKQRKKENCEAICTGGLNLKLVPCSDCCKSNILFI